MIDVEAIGKRAGKKWTLSNVTCLPPDYDRCLLLLAENGVTGLALREYDVTVSALVEGGFSLPPGPTQAVWYDGDNIMVAGNSGPGTITANGVPRLLKLWKRGEPLYAARTIFAATPDVEAVHPIFSLSGGGLFQAVEITYPGDRRELYHFGWEQNFKQSRVPPKAVLLDFFQGQAIVLLRESWSFNGKRYPAGSLVSYPMAPLLGPASITIVEQAYVPPAGFGIINAKSGRDRLYIALRGAAGDRLVSIRKGAPDWPVQDINLPGSGMMTLITASNLADVALIRRTTGGEDNYFIVGRGRARQIEP